MNPDRHARTMLPIPDRPGFGLTTYDAKDPATSYPPIEPLRPPAGAPNVLVVLLDDAGFGSSSAFGGPCQTPAFERLAGEGDARQRGEGLVRPLVEARLLGRGVPLSRPRPGALVRRRFAGGRPRDLNRAPTRRPATSAFG